MPPVQPKTRAHAPLPPVCARSSTPVPQPESGSVLQLPRLIAVVGPRTALLQRRWIQGPQLVTSALGTELPGTSTQTSLPEPEQTELPRDRPARRTQTPAQEPPLKVSEVLQLLCTGGPSQVFYLREAPGPVHRPYELQVVAPSEAGEEHYIFCRSGVIHMTISGYGGMSSLTQWYKEAVSWTILQNIPFFRLFRLRKAFCWWRARVRCCRFLQLREHLQSLLLTDSALYRAAQAAHARALEEVRVTPWLPQSGAYNLTGLTEAQQNHKEQFQRKLRDLSQSCREVLQTVQQQSLQSLQHLKHHIHLSEQARCFRGPMHLQWRHQQQLRRERLRAQRDVTRLSSLARLLHYMTLETLLCVLQRHVHAFVLRVVQTQSLVFHTQLSVSAHGQLRVEPALHCFSQLLRDLLSPTYFLQQVCDIFDETSAQDRFSSRASDLSKLSTTFSPESMRHSVQEFCCCQLVKCQQSPDLVQQFWATGHPGACGLPEAPGQIQSLHRELLEWTLSMCDLSKAVGAAERFMQEESDLDWLYDKYSWLLKVREFVESWGPALSVDPRGPCAGAYEEHIVKVQKWLCGLRSVPPSVSSTRRLFVIRCTGVTQELEEQLKVISEELLMKAVEQVRVSSETLLSELERLVADLLPTPQDFTHYTVKVKQGFSLWPDLKQRLEDTRSVQNMVVIHYRDVSAEEHKLSEQMERVWSRFLELLQQAEGAVCRGLPVHTHTLNLVFSFCRSDLARMVSRLSDGVFLEPTQDPAEMCSTLKVLWRHVQTRRGRLEQLTAKCDVLQAETPKDLSLLIREIQQAEARKQVWETLAACAEWREECSTVLFSEMDVVQTQRALEEQSGAVQSAHHDLPLADSVLQRAVNELQQQRHQLEVLSTLKNPHLKYKHWKAILQAVGLRHVPVADVTVGQLLSQSLEQKQCILEKIVWDAKAQHQMECDFQKLQKQWSEKLVTLQRYPSSTEEPWRESIEQRTWTVTDVDVHLSQIHLDVTMLSYMLTSPYSEDFRPELDHWLHLMNDLENTLHIFKRFQQSWIFLTKVLSSWSVSSCVDLKTLFKPVDAQFRQVMDHISRDSHALILLEHFHSFTSGLSAMDAITTQTREIFDFIQSQCSRLRFLSDRELIQLFSSPPSPSTMLPAVRKLFRGVRELDVCLESQATLGIVGSLQEHLTFASPVKFSIKATEWLSDFVKQLHLSMVGHMRDSFIVKEQLGPPLQVMCDGGRLVKTKLTNGLIKQVANIVGLLATHPSQCLLVAEEAEWLGVIEKALPHPIKVNNVNFFLSRRVEVLGHYIQDRVPLMLPDLDSTTSASVRHFLRSLVQMTMNHSEKLSQLRRVEGPLHSSFEWLSLFKYHLSVQSSQELLCYVDVLNQRLQYGFEYVGSGDWIIPFTPSTERAKLGIVLALANFWGGLINGPCKTSKENLVVQLGMALGRMVFVFECDPSVKLVTVENVLLGSLQTGAWLCMVSADLLSAKVSATLEHLLRNIREFFSKMKEGKVSTNLTPMCNIAAKEVPASYNYGCLMILSRTQTCSIPEDLLTAFRPIALTHPDYKFIAEVMLTSMGFVDAKYLSQRLVSLIQFSTDCSFLPSCKSKSNSCFFSILQNVIDLSEKYLEHCRRQRNVFEKKQSMFIVVQSLIEEAAVCSSIVSVLLPWTHELNKAQEFHQLLKEIFPAICQFQSIEHYLEEHEKSEVEVAILEVLRINDLQPDGEMINNAFTLYQHLKSGKAVILSGPSGSGKTSCYSILAQALNFLATQSEKRNKAFVRPVVLFPNSMSHKQLLGHDCDHKGWQDGALSTFLRNCGDVKGVENWLVLDGEEPSSRAEEPSWMDIAGALYHSPGPFMCLASGMPIIPPQEHLQIILEVTDLSAASPGTLIACNLVNFTGCDLWRAVWKSAMGSILQKYQSKALEDLWETLAEELFPATLRLLGQNCASPANYSESGSSRRPPIGLQEIMSFFRIFSALVEHFEVCLNIHNAQDKGEGTESRGVSQYQSDTTGAGLKDDATKMMLARSCFLMAYVWGFGGHLHPSAWPRFQCIARKVLSKSRYKIQVPEGESLFEYFATSDRRVCLQTAALTSPKYGIYTHLMSIMLEAKRPVLLVGEPASGKTTVCQGLLGYKSPCVRLSGSAVMGPSDLLSVFRNTSRASQLLLFVDDLHATSPGFTDTSPALEVLRQSVSTGGVTVFADSSLRSLTTGTVSYMCTSSTPSPLSPRLTRLFSIFTLPVLTPDLIFSLHAHDLKLWTQTLLPNTTEMARRFVSATHSLYLALLEKYAHAVDGYGFSIYDVQKVFQGMTLWKINGSITNSDPSKILIDIVKLWLHECTHTFIDRVTEEGQRSNLERILVDISADHFGSIFEQSEVFENPESSCSPEKDPTTGNVRVLISECVQNVDVVYCPEVPEFLRTQQNHSDCQQIAYKPYKLDVLTETLRNSLQKHIYPDHEAGFLRAYELHRQRARQLAHIFRVLLVPGAHAVLLASHAGTGRRSTVRCATQLTGADLLEVHLGNEEELSMVLKEASDRSRVRGTRVVLLVHADVSAAIRERLLLVMAGHTGRGLHTQEEIEKHVVTVTSNHLSQRYHRDQWMLDRLLSQSHKNIHIVMLMPHSSPEVSPELCTLWTTQMRRAAERSCCVEVYRPWSYQSLRSTADFWLQTNAYGGDSVHGVAEAMARLHVCARHHASSLLRQQPVSPASYLHFLHHFCELFPRLQEKAQQEAHRLETVVSRLEEMNNTAQDSLRTQRERIHALQQEQGSVLGTIADLELLLHESQNTIVQEQTRLTELEKQLQETQQKVQAALEARVRKVSCLELSALEEVRGYRDPPEPVTMVMDAVCLLFHHPPGWDSAKHLLSLNSFFQELEFFDHRRVSTQQLQELATMVHSPAFDPEVVAEASQACAQLCHWVLAVYECCKLHPYVKSSHRMETEAAAARKHLQLARRRKKEQSRQLKIHTRQLESVREQLRQHTEELLQAERVHREATCAVDELGTRVSVWKGDVQRAVTAMEALPGDTLLTAAIISYLGPFGADTRCELLAKWRGLCTTGRPCPAPECSQCGPLSAPLVPVSSLPHGPLCRALGVSERPLQAEALSDLLLSVLLSSCSHNCVQRCPLLVDPEHCLDPHQPHSCFRGDRITAVKDFEVDLCADDPHLLEKLEEAVRTGALVLVRAAERSPSCPRLLSIVSQACFSLTFYTTLPAHMLTTEMPGPLLRRLRVVDLSLSTLEVERCLQSQLLPPDGRLILSQQKRLEQSRHRLIEKLSSTEASMIDYIVQCERPLLDDAGFAEKVHAFHELWDEVWGELQQEEAALCDRAHSLSPCRPLFTLCAAVYRAVQQVALLSPLYCYSLERMVRVLGAALSGGMLSHCAPPGAMEELSQRVLSWVLQDYEPCLFKSHAQVFKVLLCVALLQHRQLCSPAERQLFLRGLRTKDHLHSETWTEPCYTFSTETECVSESSAELPPWIPAHTVPQLRSLEQLPAFRGLLSSLRQAPELWQEYMRVPSTVIGPVPFEPFQQLCLLQRALLWRLLRPECLQRVAEDLCACVLSEVPLCGVPQDMTQLLLLHSGPIILSGAPHSGSEALGVITLLALHAQVSVMVLCCWEQASLITALRKAPDRALWLVLKNAHLLEPWDPLWPQIHHLIHRSKGLSEEPSHRMLQFWFIVPEKHIFRIPICVRQSALALALDSCWTLAEQVQRSMWQMDVFSHRGQCLQSCVLFHSVLMQRRTGPEHSYTWCGSDLQALVQAYSDIAPLCSDQAGALQYLAVSLVHGAHVLDTTHLEEIRSVAQAYLLPASQRNHEWSLLDMAGQRDSCVPVPALEARSLGFGDYVIEERIQKRSHTLDVLLQASQGTCVGDMSNRTGAVPLVQRLRALEAHMRARTEAPEPRPGPLKDFLQGEWDTLRHVVSSGLSPMSPPPSEAELKQLERRVDLLTSYLWQCESLQPQALSLSAFSRPQALSLSAFSRPQGFLLSLRRHYSHAQGTQLSHTSLLFQLVADPDSRPHPPYSVYICGLELRGAVWDPEHGLLRDGPCAGSPLPLLCISPRPMSAVAPGPGAPLIYLCPLYVEKELVAWVPLSSRLEPQTCSLRRVRIVSSESTQLSKL